MLMLWHHLFAFPSWYKEEVEINYIFGHYGILTTNILAYFGNICVQIFAIISGYSLFKMPDSYNSIAKRAKRLFHFLYAYWLIILLFVIIGLINNDNIPSLSQLLYNMVGLNTGPSFPYINVPFAWYVAYYIQFILLSPILIRIFNTTKKPFFDILILFFILITTHLLCILPFGEPLSQFFSYSHPLFCAGLGIIAAKYNLFTKMHNKFCKLHSSVFILITIILILLKFKFHSFLILSHLSTNLIYYHAFFSVLAFVLIFCLIELTNRIKSLWVQNSLIFIGSISIFLWFMQGIFFTGNCILQLELYQLKEPILIYFCALFILIPSCFLVNKFYRFTWNKFQFLWRQKGISIKSII